MEEISTKKSINVDTQENSMKRANKNIAITGKRQVGKTTLLKQVMSTNRVDVKGYQTIPYQLEGEFSGYEMMNVSTGEKKAISSKQYDGSFCPLVDTFEDFGTKLLLEALQSEAPVLMLDEIGRFERTAHHFITYLHKAFDSDKFILAVLKKEPIEFIEKIKEREDIVLIDLDEMSWEEAYELVEYYFKLYFK